MHTNKTHFLIILNSFIYKRCRLNSVKIFKSKQKLKNNITNVNRQGPKNDDDQERKKDNLVNKR